MRKPFRLILVAAMAVAALASSALLLREPKYRGRTMGEWLQHRDDPQASEAIIALGTNHLPLLVARLDYDRRRDHIARALDLLPATVRARPAIDSVALLRSRRSKEAREVLEALGPNAAQALPQLAKIAHRDDSRSFAALDVLAWAGDQGLDIVASVARASTNPLVRQQAISLLCAHRPSQAARDAMTNALSDPDGIIRAVAQSCVTNASWYTLPPGKPGNHFE